eukprot:gene2587-1606_t
MQNCFQLTLLFVLSSESIIISAYYFSAFFGKNSTVNQIIELPLQNLIVKKMEEQLKEIEGTLARTKERKNTILYKHARKAEQEQRLAKLQLREIPTNPATVNDVQIIKYILYQLNRQLGEKKAFIKDSSKISIENDGEAHVRAINDEINKLIRRKFDWERRMAQVSGKEETRLGPKRKLFFGCAKGLPEAVRLKTTKRERLEELESLSSSASSEENFATRSVSSDRESEPDESASHLDDQIYFAHIDNLLKDSTERILLQHEKLAEKQFRSPKIQNETAGATQVDTSFIGSFMKDDGSLGIPDEEHFKNLLMHKRKEALLAQLSRINKMLCFALAFQPTSEIACCGLATMKTTKIKRKGKVTSTPLYPLLKSIAHKKSSEELKSAKIPVTVEEGSGQPKDPFYLPLRSAPNNSGCMHCPTLTCQCLKMGVLLSEVYKNVPIRRITEVAGSRHLCAKSLLPPFVTRLIRLMKITGSDTFYDFGCGNGSILFQVACLTGAKCVGVEISRHNAALAREAYKILKAKVVAVGLPEPKVSIIEGDIGAVLADDSFFTRNEEGGGKPAILVSNLLFPKSLTHYMSEVFRRLPPGSRFTCFDDFYPHGRAIAAIRDPEAFQLFDMKDYLWQEMSVECTITHFFFVNIFLLVRRFETNINQNHQSISQFLPYLFFAGIAQASAVEQVEEHMSVLHEALFGDACAAVSPLSLKQQIEKVMKEMDIRVTSRASRRAVPFTPHLLPEACLLLADMLVSLSNEVPAKPPLSAYTLRLENALLPTVFMHSQVTPQQLVSPLLCRPMSVFQTIVTSGGFDGSYYAELAETCEQLKMNFGIDLLKAADRHPPPEAVGCCERNGSPSPSSQLGTPATVPQHSVPAYLLTRKRPSWASPLTSTVVTPQSTAETRTPDDSDSEEILAAETPEKSYPAL